MWPLDEPVFAEAVLPFLLVFVLVFAVLQKTKVLGDGKKQIDALVSLVIGLILISVQSARDFIVGILPWLAVGLVVILVFMLLYGFVGSDLKKGLELRSGTKNIFLALSAIFVIALVVFFSGLWNLLRNYDGDAGSWLPSVLLIVVVIVAVAVAMGGKKKDDD